jgi:predicted metal-dependent hydrolase
MQLNSRDPWFYSQVPSKNKDMPEWAKELTERVVKENSRRKVPPIAWRKVSRSCSSGKARMYSQKSGYMKYSCILIRAGTSEQDQKLVLLHELAHWMCSRGERHSMKFWRLAFDLYAKYGVDSEYAKKRESDYKKKATFVIAERGL